MRARTDARAGAVARRWRSIFSVIAAVGTALACAGCGSGPERGQRVVLITLDTLRADTVLGSDPAMPRLVDWSEGAANFERFFAATSSTAPSHASMLTGRHPWQHGVTKNGKRLGLEHQAVAEILGGAGYSTAAVVASFPVAAVFGFGQGFDSFDDDFTVGMVTRAWAEYVDENQRSEVAQKPFFSLAETITNRAVAELDRATGERQFFWFHYFDPHDPYGDSVPRGPKVYPGELRKRADGELDLSGEISEAHRLYELDVTAMDKWLARLLERLEADGALFDTHIVVVSDHGESFGEDGSLAHGSRLNSPQIQVPCLIRSPLVRPGTRYDVAGSVDVFATLLDLAGVEGAQIAGRTLRSEPVKPARAYGMRRLFASHHAVRRLDGQVYPVGDNLFYAVLSDGVILRGNRDRLEPPPGGFADDDLPDMLVSLFDAFTRELEGGHQDDVLDEESRRALEALGYVQ